MPNYQALESNVVSNNTGIFIMLFPGSKYGDYGSFLPTHERVPSVLHQEKPPSAGAVDGYGRGKRSPNEGIVEVIHQIIMEYQRCELLWVKILMIRKLSLSLIDLSENEANGIMSFRRNQQLQSRCWNDNNRGWSQGSWICE